MADDEARIVVRPNGPLRVYGPFKLFDDDGNEFPLPEGEWVTLCRCGKSANKPFCDSRHKEEEWHPETRAPGAQPSAGERPNSPRSSPPHG